MPRIELNPALIGGGNAINAFQSAYSNGLKNQASQLELEQERYKMNALNEDRGQQNALAKLLATQGFDPTSQQGQSQMYGAGGVPATQGYLKRAAEVGHTQAKTQNEAAGTRKIQLENNLQKFEIMERLLRPVQDQASYDMMRQQAAQMPELEGMAQQMPPEYNPQAIADGKIKAMSLKDKMAAEHAQMTARETARRNLADERISVDNNIRTNDTSRLNNRDTNSTSRLNNRDTNTTSRANNSASVGATMRGQNMTDARSRESNAISGGSGKPPSGYRWKTDGSLEAIPGGPAGKTASATEGERKAATLLQRLEGSEKQMSAALNENPAAAKPGLVASGLRSVGAEALANTAAVGSERQRVEAAQLDMLDAALTLGTGAAYTKEQLEGYRKSYFPQIGDTNANVSDKKARLDNIIKAAKIAAGRASPPSTPAGGGNSDIDALLNKYK